MITNESAGTYCPRSPEITCKPYFGLPPFRACRAITGTSWRRYGGVTNSRFIVSSSEQLFGSAGRASTRRQAQREALARTRVGEAGEARSCADETTRNSTSARHSSRLKSLRNHRANEETGWHLSTTNLGVPPIIKSDPRKCIGGPPCFKPNPVFKSAARRLRAIAEASNG